MIKFWFSQPLWRRIAAAFGMGIAVGIALGPSAASFKFLGDIYLNLMRMMVIPLVFFTIASSIAQLTESRNMTRLFARTIIWFLITSGLAVLVGIGFGHIIGPGLGLGQLPLGEYTPKNIPTPVEVLIGIIPSNPLKAMTDANVLQVLFFAMVVGFGLVSLREKAATLRNFISEGTNLVFWMTRGILQFTPLGTFGLTAWVVGHYGFDALLPLGKFVIAIYAACVFHMVFVYGGLLKLHGLKAWKFFKGALPAQQMAFLTSSSMATMPLTLRTVIDRLGVPKSFAGFSVPLGATMKMDGCGAIYPAISAIFIAQYFSIPLDISHYVVIAMTAVLGSIGTAGVPGTSIVMLTLTLSASGLPLEGIGYLVAIDRIVDMMRTATNVTGQMLVPVLVAKEEGILAESIYEGNTEPSVREHEELA